jgi:hypothetical protein
MKIFKKLMKFLLISVLMLGLGIFMSHYIEVGDYNDYGEERIYISDNGFHIDIIIPDENNDYTAYGWGSKVFFMEIPTWDDLTYDVAFQALFTKPASCMRVTKYDQYQSNWQIIRLSEEQLFYIKKRINEQFKYDSAGNKILIKDNYYEAKGSYWALNTCNTWANNIIKSAGLRAKLYTLNSESISELY